MSEPQDALPRIVRLPVVPLRELVVFPHLVVPLMLARDASMQAVREATAGDGMVFLLSQIDGRIDQPTKNDFYAVGSLARVLQLFRLNDETHKVIVEAVGRGRVQRLSQARGQYRATVEVIPENVRTSAESEALVRTVKAQFFSYASTALNVPENISELVELIEAPDQLADTVAAYSAFPIDVKQQLLEESDADKRLHRLAGLFEHELRVLKIQNEINDRVRQKVQKNQKAFLLREQLRAIEEELGQSDPAAAPQGEIEAAIEQSAMSEETKGVARRELQKLKRSAAMSPQAAVIEEYLHWLVSMPWRKRTEDNLDLDHAREVLDRDHYGLEEPKQRILEYLAVKRLTRDTQKEPILCLVGPPGVGKTSLARSVAESLGRKFVRKSLGGIRDEAEIRGHRRTYVGAMPGRIIQSIRKAQSCNPVFLLDEIDKLAADFHGDPASALLEVLDPDENHSFSDHYLEVEFDLSDVLFITTANLASAISPVLRDRMEMIEVSGYTLEEKLQIARRHLVPRQFAAHGLRPRDLRIHPSALARLIEQYTSEAGVRNLNKRLADLCRKVAARLARRKRRSAAKPVSVTAANLAEFLGPEPFHEDRPSRDKSVGVATGLAWTEVGGRLMTVEASWMRGRGRITLTGQLGDVMQESARAALTFVRSRADAFGIDANVFDTVDLHIHVPEGATPKDGPSAGVAMVAAVVSALTARCVRNDVATTGEITLRGRVLPIGGLKEKVLAAHRRGIHTIVLPEGNRPDLAKIPEEIRAATEFVFVSDVDQALRTLVPEALTGRASQATAATLPPALSKVEGPPAPPPPSTPLEPPPTTPPH